MLSSGAFHIWEELQAPIVPFIIYGAFDLYPVGSWVNQTGKVTVRYLPPLTADSVSSRDEMLIKVFPLFFFRSFFFLIPIFHL
jgi:1-acyl-sn-glycerol-3-phosphate acyltransferase